MKDKYGMYPREIDNYISILFQLSKERPEVLYRVIELEREKQFKTQKRSE